MAVNTYRFLALYIMIGLLMGTITAIKINAYENEQGFDLGQQEQLSDIELQTLETLEQGDDLVQSDSLQLSRAWGDERGLGRNFVQILLNGFLPTGFIAPSEAADALPHERIFNWVVIIFRSIITIFASYEAFQIIIKAKVT